MLNEQAAPAPADDTVPSAPQLQTVLLTDLCDSVALVEKLGDSAAAELFQHHDRLVLMLQQQWRGRLIDRSDGLLLLFDRPVNALAFAMDYMRGLQELGRERKLKLRARAGIHVGEVVTWHNSVPAVQAGAKPLEVEGLAKPLAARLMSLARPGQILLSAVAESLAHRAARDELGERNERLLWKSHGRWRFKGVPTVQEVYEAGEIGVAPLRAPRNSPKAWRDLPLWRRPAALVAEVALVALLGIGVWFVSRPQPAIAFSERDWVVVGDLRNLTGDSLLDDSLQQAFRISLEQSRYVNVVSDERTRRTLDMMRRNPQATRLDRETAADVAQRLGVRLVLLPSVADVGGRKRFTVEMMDPAQRQTLLVSSAYASNSTMLAAIDTVTAELRDKLGESPADIRQDSQPLPEVTTASLDALRAYALGQRKYAEGDYVAALAFYDSAIDIDNAFALAWLGKVRAYYASLDFRSATDALKKATTLSEHLPPREAMYARNWQLQMLQPDQAGDGWARMADLYPDFIPAAHNAALNYFEENRFQDARVYSTRVAESRYELSSVGVDQHARVLLALGDYTGAEAAFRKAVELGWRSSMVRQATAVAAKGEFGRAYGLIEASGRPDLGEPVRVSIALDEGRPGHAVERAEAAVREHGKTPGVEGLAYFVPLATAYLADGRRSDAIATARDAVRMAMTDIDNAVPQEATDRATIALAAAIVAQRAGDRALAEQVSVRLGRAQRLPAGRALQEFRAVVAAGSARLAGNPKQALELLEPFVDGQSRIQTRVELLHAATAAGDAALAEAQLKWLRERRGMAYAEIECVYCLQALNVLEVNKAIAAAPENTRGATAVGAMLAPG